MRLRRPSEDNRIKNLTVRLMAAAFGLFLPVLLGTVCLPVTTFAAQSAESERERMEGFSAYVKEEGLTDAVVGFGDFSEDGEVSFTDGYPDSRMQGMFAQMRAMDAEYGPLVKDVVTVITRPDRDSNRLSEMAALAQGAAAYDPSVSDGALASAADSGPGAGVQGVMQSPATPESIITMAEQQVTSRGIGFLSQDDLSSLRREVSGALSGNSFPTTNWRRFGTELVDLGTFTLTAYDPCIQCCGKTDGITATGTKGFTGRTVAVDPAVIPYGSRLLIGGYVFIAEDTGGAIKGKHIDIFMDTHDVAMQFGRREDQVLLIR
ncbi:MAG: 3D domain-containing protein [Lachnospiraceae bacterium]|nr:3D domain-containing protein [Lachnospiraceae bacterium]